MLSLNRQMTAYHGGKNRTGENIANCITEQVLKIQKKTGIKIKGYCEPFCGMLGVYRHIPTLFEDNGINDIEYVAGDTNESVILMWKAAQKGWKPPKTCSERTYNRLKNNPNPSAEKGFCCHQFSFGGEYCGSYACNYGKSKDATTASNRVIDIADELYDVKFYQGQYDMFSNLKGFVLYCDPPYSNSKSLYKTEEKTALQFDTNKFWKWVEEMAKHNIVFVSEYKAPKGFKCILKQKHLGQQVYNNKKYTFDRNEKLFIHLRNTST